MNGKKQMWFLPIRKSERQVARNYRLVSLLPICGKIFGLLLCNNLFEFFIKNSFIKFAERDPDKNVFDDTTKSNFQTTYFKPNEVKQYLRSTNYLEKINVLLANIRSIKRNFENLKALLEKLLSIHVSETWCLNTKLQNNWNLSFTGFDSVSYERSKKNRVDGVLIFI